MKKDRKKSVIVLSFVLIMLCGMFAFASCSDQKETEKKTDAVSDKETDENKKKEDAEEQESEDTGNLDQEEQDANTSVNDTTEKKETDAASSDAAKTQTTSVSTSKTTSGSSENTTNKNTHTHNWAENTTTVHHEEVGHYENVCVKEAWTEEVPVYETVAVEICGNCGEDCTADPGGHIKWHMLNGTGKYGWHTEYRQKQTGTQTVSHPAEYGKQWIVDQMAYDETVVTYKCSCGATK